MIELNTTKTILELRIKVLELQAAHEQGAGKLQQAVALLKEAVCVDVMAYNDTGTDIRQFLKEIGEMP
tara:strand:- start:135 stop:338 length:204 start_codon:yes stop_codon:yes gene_type:complete